WMPGRRQQFTDPLLGGHRINLHSKELRHPREVVCILKRKLVFLRPVRRDLRAEWERRGRCAGTKKGSAFLPGDPVEQDPPMVFFHRVLPSAALKAYLCSQGNRVTVLGHQSGASSALAVNCFA